MRAVFERAAISTLFLQIVDKFRCLYANEAAPKQTQTFSKILILRLLNLSLGSNMAAGQYITCERILQTLEMTFQDIYFDENENDFVDFRNMIIDSKQILDEDKVKNGGVTLNYGTLLAK